MRRTWGQKFHMITLLCLSRSRERLKLFNLPLKRILALHEISQKLSMPLIFCFEVSHQGALAFNLRQNFARRGRRWPTPEATISTDRETMKTPKERSRIQLHSRRKPPKMTRTMNALQQSRPPMQLLLAPRKRELIDFRTSC